MTTREARGLTVESDEESKVERYLQQNPDFFERHHALLARLRLPHARSAATVSLIERQVEVMRERQSELEGKLAEFVRIARANDALADRVHRFTRRLVVASTRADVVHKLETSLREDFDAFHSALIVVAGNEAGLGPAFGRFARVHAADDRDLRSFESLFASGKPRCGQIRDTQRAFLFGNDASEIGSVALIPLGERGALGLLALGSADRDRFHPGMSTEFLARMGEIITDALAARA
jgi:hypothetical protein